VTDSSLFELPHDDGKLPDVTDGLAALSRQDEPTAPPEVTSSAEDPVRVIPLDGSRDASGHWTLVVPPASAADRARKRLHSLREDGQLSLTDDLLEGLALSAVDPSVLETAPVSSQRVDTGWLQMFELRLFTPLANVAIANDRWVADAVYDADPKATGDSGAVAQLTAVPMPRSHESFAALVYEADVATLLSAADANYRKVLEKNRQDVGRRLVEQPVTLVPTIVEAPAAVGDVGKRVLREFASVDGNCRVSSALDRLRVLVEWLPALLRDKAPFSTLERGTEVPLTPSLLMNLTVAERRTLVRRIAKRASDRLAQPAKALGQRGYARDVTERNQAAVTLNVLTVPARVIVGWVDDERAQYGMSRFASAVRALLVQMNVEGTPLEESARNAISAEEIVLDLAADEMVSTDTATVLIGRQGVADAMRALGLNPEFPDLRAALVLQVLTNSDDKTRAVLRERLDKTQVHPGDRSRPAVELALRSYTASLAREDLGQARKALDSGCVWPDLVTREWHVSNVETAGDVDVLAKYAQEQRESGGPALRLLGVLGMFALVTTGHLLAPRGSAAEQVGGREIDRTGVGSIIAKILRHEWGITLLADAVKRVRAGEPALRWVDEDGALVEPEDWRPSDFDANLRLAARQRATHAAVIPGSTTERFAWTAFAEAVVTAKEKFTLYATARTENKTIDRLPWPEVEATVKTLRALTQHIGTVAEPEPLDAL
jgi:hypothetical protein